VCGLVDGSDTFLGQRVLAAPVISSHYGDETLYFKHTMVKKRTVRVRPAICRAKKQSSRQFAARVSLQAALDTGQTNR
jgi:hypothetical protein